jgi:hypothetical protein
MIKHYTIVLLTLITGLFINFPAFALPSPPPYTITVTLANDQFAPVVPLSFDASKSQNCVSKVAGTVVCTIYHIPDPPTAVAELFFTNTKKPNCSIDVTLANTGDGFSFSMITADYDFTFDPTQWNGYSSLKTTMTVSKATTPGC